MKITRKPKNTCRKRVDGFLDRFLNRFLERFLDTREVGGREVDGGGVQPNLTPVRFKAKKLLTNLSYYLFVSRFQPASR